MECHIFGCFFITCQFNVLAEQLLNSVMPCRSIVKCVCKLFSKTTFLENKQQFSQISQIKQGRFTYATQASPMKYFSDIFPCQKLSYIVLILGKTTTYGFSHLHQRVHKKESVSHNTVFTSLRHTFPHIKNNRCILLFLPYLSQHSHIHLIHPVTEQVDVLPVMTDDKD